MWYSLSWKVLCYRRPSDLCINPLFTYNARFSETLRFMYKTPIFQDPPISIHWHLQSLTCMAKLYDIECCSDLLRLTLPPLEIVSVVLVLSTRLREAPPSMRSVPPQAKECVLWGIQPLTMISSPIDMQTSMQ